MQCNGNMNTDNLRTRSTSNRDVEFPRQQYKKVSWRKAFWPGLECQARHLHINFVGATSAHGVFDFSHWFQGSQLTGCRQELLL